MDISKAVIALLKTKPFYAHFITSMQVYEDSNVPTAGVNVQQKINLYVNPDFWETLPLNHQIGVLEHEVNHILYNHISRGEQLNKAAHNIATDVAINGYIGVNSLPDTALFPEKLRMKKYQTSEFYYNFLIKHSRQCKWGLKTASAASNGKGGQRGTLDDHGLWDKGNKDEDYVKEKIRNVVNRVCDVLDSEGKGIGSLPANIQEIIKKLRKKPMDWRLILRRFLHHATLPITVSSRKRRNRRFGIVFPGSKTDPVLKLGVVIDSSGSISNHQLNVFMNEITGINMVCAETHIIVCDAEVHDVYKYNKREGIRPIKGRGGTAFQPALDVGEKLKVDALCYLTDGYNGDRIKKPTFPVLWAITRDGRRPVPWGTMISLKDEKPKKEEE